MNISHRTDRADARARNITPVPVDLPDLPAGAADRLAAAMLDEASSVRRFTSHGKFGRSKKSDTEDAILAALDGKKTAVEIAEECGFAQETVRRILVRMMADGRVLRSGPRNLRIWAKA